MRAAYFFTTITLWSAMLQHDGMVTSLRCYNNECRHDGNAFSCTYEGFGIIEECHGATNKINDCFETLQGDPKTDLDAEIKRGCSETSSRKPQESRICSGINGVNELCLCFEDLCNKKYDYSHEYAIKVVDGKAA